MQKTESIEEFYQRKFGSIPERIQKEIGHFNVFKLDPFVGRNAKPVPYKKRDYYKIMLAIGNSRVNYADRVIEVKKQALSFSNPQIPYKWESTETIQGGLFCVFDESFFHQFGNLEKYSVFQPNGTHIFELSDDQVMQVSGFFERMFKEIDSDYIYKYDVLRTLVFELVHFAMKLRPSASIDKQEIDASQRITMLFQELLERQFPIDTPLQTLSLRSPSDYANRLNVHVNHLNRALKEKTHKTTSQHINDRILKEAKILLKHSSWNISEIGYALGFSEATHFSNFFKKHTQISPSDFRNI